jgi:hypothetical protein
MVLGASILGVAGYEVVAAIVWPLPQSLGSRLRWAGGGGGVRTEYYGAPSASASNFRELHNGDSPCFFFNALFVCFRLSDAFVSTVLVE